MSNKQDTRETIEKEFQLAHVFFEQGQEGKGRVCARKAAGMAARRWLDIHNPNQTTRLSPFEALEKIQDINFADPKLHESLNHLIMKVDENYQLPANIHLLESARVVIDELLKEV